MAKTIIYFTESAQATSGELADIVKLNAAAEAPYRVLVVNGSANAKYGELNRLIPGDFVAGSVPAIYEIEVEDERVYPEIDPDDLPVVLPSDQVAIADGQVVETADGGTVTFSVSNNEITSAVYAAGE